MAKLSHPKFIKRADIQERPSVAGAYWKPSCILNCLCFAFISACDAGSPMRALTAHADTPFTSCNNLANFCPVKLKFHGSSFLAARGCRRRHVTRKSSVHVGRVGRGITRMLIQGCYSHLSATIVRVGLVEFGERHDTRTNGQHYTVQQIAGQADQSGKRVHGMQAKRVRRPTRTTSS